jgi:hypothetical protein
MLKEAQHKLAQQANLLMIDGQLVTIASTLVLAANDFPQSTEE